MKFRTLSIKRKLFLILMVFTLIPACLLSAWIYTKVSGNWREKEYSNQSNELGNILKTTELQLKEYEKVIYRFYQNEDCARRLRTAREERSLLDYVEITKYFRDIVSDNEKIASTYFFAKDGENFRQDATTTERYMSMYKENPAWEEQIQLKNGAITWIPTFMITTSRNIYRYLSCGVLVKDLESSAWKPLGILVLNINVSFFDELFELLGQKNDLTTYLITDDAGNIIWSNHETFPATLDLDFFACVQSADKPYSEQRYRDDTYIVTRMRSEYNGWNYISMKSKAEVLKAANWVLLLIAVELILLLLATVLGAYIIQRYMLHPIQKLAAAMNAPENELVRVQLSTNQEDEIGLLYRSFNEMNDRLERFIEKTAVMNKKEKEYQMQVLNAQINPHFIYNTLDTVQWMAMAVPAPDICRLIASFSDILRYSISKKESVVTLEEELSCIRNYLNIYEERYEAKFCSFEIDKRIYPYRTFKMLLQPIVENCIVHGFEQNVNEASLEVRGTLDDDEAVICIEDNGVGISEERISYILSMDSDRVGISNINQRLRLLYGEEYGLQIYSEKGKGTTVMLRFPKTSLSL